MIEAPAAINSRPMAIVQRRSKPVNGSVLFEGSALTPLAAVVEVDGELLSFEGEVPAAGVVGVVLVGVVGVVLVGVVGVVGVVVGGGAVVV